MSGERLRTARLELIAAGLDSVRAMAEGNAALERALRVAVPREWPPEMLDEGAMKWLIRLYEKDPEAGGWGMWFTVLREGPVLIGGMGFKGRPGVVGGEGTVEVGYGVIGPYQRRGYATEATGALVDWAFGHADVGRVIAHTFERHEPSIRVLARCGFELGGAGFEKVDEKERQGRGELVYYELKREQRRGSGAARSDGVAGER